MKESPIDEPDAALQELSRLDRSDRVCDLYEREWLNGRQPLIEDFLARVAAPEQPNLLRELELIRCHYAGHHLAGDTPDVQQTIRMGRTVATRRKGELPKRVGRYEINRLLGQGGFGKVYLAHDEQLDRLVAIKVPHTELVSQTANLGMYLSEARIAAKLDHPHIVPVYDVGTTSDYPCYVVSKYIEGCDLAATIKAQRLGINEAAELVAVIAEALHYAHTQGVIHRDVKPSNILIDACGKPHLVDLGLALREENIGEGPTYLGTPAYMSPEQARGDGHRVDARSDVFSLGIVLYELLVGRRPFTGETPAELLGQLTSCQPRPLRQENDSVPVKLERICHQALAKELVDRYASAQDFAADLRRFLSDDEMEQSAESVDAIHPQSAVRQAGPWLRIWSALKSNRPLVIATSVLALLLTWWFSEVVFGVNAIRQWTEAPGLFSPRASGSGLGSTGETPHAAGNGEIDRVESTDVAKDQPAGDWRGWPADAPPPAIAPFSADQARQHQQAWADYLGVAVERVIELPNGEKLTMVLIPPGEFLMGSTDDDRTRLLKDAIAHDQPWMMNHISREGPQHPVRLTQPFWMGRFEVTLIQFRQFADQDDYKTEGERDGIGGYAYVDGQWTRDPRQVWNSDYPFPRVANEPVTYVSWNDSKAFCQWLSERQDRVLCRLPTEAEWEYACRAGTTRIWCGEDSDAELPQYAWFKVNAGGNLHPVGQLRANPFGLYDMLGNVWEWCGDRYGEDYPRAPSEAESMGVVRGGDWVYGASCCRPAFRQFGIRESRSISLGFRIAASIDTVER